MRSLPALEEIIARGQLGLGAKRNDRGGERDQKESVARDHLRSGCTRMNLSSTRVSSIEDTATP
jgi:hypothetical protein